MSLAVIAADFVTWKHVPSRKVYQLVLEIPQERAPEVAQALGWPDPATGCPVAVARLNELAVGQPTGSEGARGTVGNNPRKGQGPRSLIRPGAPGRRRFDELTEPQQAGIRCADADFRKFLVERHYALDTEEGAAEAVREICKVKSRAELDDCVENQMRWHTLDAEYMAWSGRIAECRS